MLFIWNNKNTVRFTQFINRFKIIITSFSMMNLTSSPLHLWKKLLSICKAWIYIYSDSKLTVKVLLLSSVSKILLDADRFLLPKQPPWLQKSRFRKSVLVSGSGASIGKFRGFKSMDSDLFRPLEQPKKPLQNTLLSVCMGALSAASNSFASNVASFFTPRLDFSTC